MPDVTQLFALARAHHEAGRWPQAEQFYRQILYIDPRHELACNCLGVALARQGKFGEAADCFQQALQLRPSDADAHNNLGNIFSAQGNFDAAIARYQQALALRPDHAEAHFNLGNAFRRMDKLDEAQSCYEQAIRLRPDYGDAHGNLAIVFAGKGMLEESAAHHAQAVKLNPQNPEFHANLGSLLRQLRRLDEAAGCYETALRLNPACAAARWNRSLLGLLQGDYRRAWPEYEWRWKQPKTPPRDFSQPQWDGSSLGGRTILLHAEQGLGDTLQFIRYAPLVKARGGRVIVECQPPLTRILAGVQGTDKLLPRGSPLPDFAVHCPLLTLPAIFHTSLANIPEQVPYLEVDQGLVEHWRSRLAKLRGFKIGVAWQGSLANPARQRTIPAVQFATLAGIPGIDIVSLQKGPGEEQLPTLKSRATVVDFGAELDATAGPFMDTAAIMKNLDLVVCSDTAIPHLAGALGVPVWVALPFDSDWRWLLEREDSPWYPTMRLFRQGRAGEWDDVFERIAGRLAAVQQA